MGGYPDCGVSYFMDIKTQIEHNVRYILGQRLTGPMQHADHLRFNMGGQRDGENGLQNNISLMTLFKNIPVTVRGTYNYKIVSPFDEKYILTFHKGGGILYTDGKNGEENGILSFGGDGTIDIVIQLIMFFNLQKQYTY